MKTPAFIALFVILHSSFVIAQGGPLTPPGPPGPAMTTLSNIANQITVADTKLTELKGDARTPISAAPFNITQPGSYYLTGNLSVTSGAAIDIDADNVTLDLNGFTLSSTHATGSGFAIFIDIGHKKIRIRNGHIMGNATVTAGVFTPGGFNGGIGSPSSANRGIHISDIRVSNVGGGGISIASSSTVLSVVENCMVNVCSGTGISAYIITNSSASDCGSAAIDGGTVSGSYGASIGTDSGDHGIIGTTVTNSTGVSASGTGISGNLVSFSRGRRDGGVAISAISAIGCIVSGTGTVTASQKHLGTP